MVGISRCPSNYTYGQAPTSLTFSRIDLQTSHLFEVYFINPTCYRYREWLTQQQADTVIWMVFRPGWQTSLRYSGLWEVLCSPLSIHRGVAFTDTCTDAGQFVFICRSSWWKHFSCNSRSDLRKIMIGKYYVKTFFFFQEALFKSSMSIVRLAAHLPLFSRRYMSLNIAKPLH